MRHTTVRISETTRELLRSLAEAEGVAMQTVLERAVEIYRRRRFLDQVNTAYAALRGNDRAWADVAKEREGWDATLSDGLAAEGRVPYTAQSPSSRKRRSKR